MLLVYFCNIHTFSMYAMYMCILCILCYISTLPAKRIVCPLNFNKYKVNISVFQKKLF